MINALMVFEVPTSTWNRTTNKSSHNVWNAYIICLTKKSSFGFCWNENFVITMDVSRCEWCKYTGKSIAISYHFEFQNHSQFGLICYFTFFSQRIFKYNKILVNPMLFSGFLYARFVDCSIHTDTWEYYLNRLIKTKVQSAHNSMAVWWIRNCFQFLFHFSFHLIVFIQMEFILE